MNFFGHAVAACWNSDDPAFVLGAMLPDFASMCGGKLATIGDDTVADGVAFHHRCDAVFHRAPAFRELMRWLEQRLRARRVRRGGARGAAHVGVELLLDGALLDDAAAAHAYPRALDHGRRGDAELSWRQPEHAERWRGLIDRLADHGMPHGYADAQIVAERVTRILARRPLLALTDTESGIVGEVLVEARERVHDRAAELCNHVRAQLDLPIRQQR